MSGAASRQFAIVTGGTSGIGYELVRQFVENGYDVLVAADRADDEALAMIQSGSGGRVDFVQADLSGQGGGVNTLYQRIMQGGRPVDALAANAGIGLGKSFFDQDRHDWFKVVDTNVVGTLELIHRVGNDMRTAGHGRILITSSIASQMPGAFQAVYNASKAFLQSFSYAIRNELKDSGVTVTALLPGPTDTDFFDRAEMGDTKVGANQKDDPAAVAKVGFKAMMAGDGDVVYGMKNKLQAAAAKIIPDDRLAEMHRSMAAPGTAEKVK